ncbi:carbonic anhydrase 9-like isoform X2 [Sardina pilchardus]
MTSSQQKFTFTGFNDKAGISKIKNTGKSVKVEFKAGKLKVSGGGLSTAYNSLQFHLHWGNSSSPGSEHTVDGKRYPMELHIVNAKSIYNGNLAKILQDSEGLAVLGFFIEVDSGTTDQPASWRTLTYHLASITEKDQSADITGISMNDLISGVDTSSYHRYLGSLTTPNCNEAVVWTVFKNPIKVSKNLIDLFSTTVRVGNRSSPLMTNVYRSVQPLNGR